MDTPAENEEQRFWRETGDSLFAWVLQTFVEPEVRRQLESSDLAVGDEIYAAQVLLRVGAPTEVRLNDEIRGQAQISATRAVKPGDEVSAEDVKSMSRFVLDHEDADAAHFTLLRHAGGWSLAFDATYNTRLSRDHLAAADQFIRATEIALSEGALRPFVENAFATAELIAKAELIGLPDEALLNGSHATIRSAYNLWAHLGNTEQRFAQLLNTLAGLRASARYLRRPFDFKLDDAQHVFDGLKDMLTHARRVVPSGSLDDDRPPRQLTLVAHQDLRRGEPVVADRALGVLLKKPPR